LVGSLCDRAVGCVIQKLVIVDGTNNAPVFVKVISCTRLNAARQDTALSAVRARTEISGSIVIITKEKARTYAQFCAVCWLQDVIAADFPNKGFVANHAVTANSVNQSILSGVCQATASLDRQINIR